MALFLVALTSPVRATQFATAWNVAGEGEAELQTRLTREPWPARRPPSSIGRDAVLDFHAGRLFVLSRVAGTLSMFVPARRARAKVLLELGSEAVLEDITVTGNRRAYLTRRNANTLLRADLRTGATTAVADLGAFADTDGIADLGSMVADRGRLFVQIRRFNMDAPQGLAGPAYVAVVDLTTEEIVDVDAATPGVQAIELQGTAPKGRMQILGPKLYVSASGGFFDAGGLERIDLDTLRSEGLIVREADGKTGADLGPFVMTTPESGFVAYSTDLDLSSHVQPFTVAGGVEVGPEVHVTVGYYMPALVYDARTDTLFVPDGAFGRQGIYAYDAGTRERRNRHPIPAAGQPTDLLLLRR